MRTALLVAVTLTLSCRGVDKLSPEQRPTVSESKCACEEVDAGSLDATECPQTFCPSCPVEPDAGLEPPPSSGRFIPGLLLDGRTGQPKCWFDVSWSTGALDALCEDCLDPGDNNTPADRCELYGLDKTWGVDLLPCPRDDSWCSSR